MALASRAEMLGGGLLAGASRSARSVFGGAAFSASSTFAALATFAAKAAQTLNTSNANVRLPMKPPADEGLILNDLKAATSRRFKVRRPSGAGGRYANCCSSVEPVSAVTDDWPP